jgi:tetratricopeptide (TPR) repeat protein
MKKLLIIIILVFAAVAVRSQVSEYQSLLQQANQFYADNQYGQAIENYEKILASNYESSVLYFNLGNAYFKNQDIPSAILNYEKALKLDPTDPDIRFNLALANSRIIDKIEPLPEFFIKSWWKSVRNSLSSNQWAKFGLAALILILVSAFLFITSRSILIRKISFWAGTFFALIMLFSFLLSASSFRNYHQSNAAIIFTPTVTVKSSPNDNSVDLFVIHEGTKVFITDHIEGWSEIKLENGNVGWLKNTAYKPV